MTVAAVAAASWVEKVCVGFSDIELKFPTEKIMDGQNFSFTPKFAQNGGFPAPNFVFLKKFYDRLPVQCLSLIHI